VIALNQDFYSDFLVSQPEVMGCSLDPVFVAPKHCAWYIFPLGGHRATIEGPEGRVNFEDPK
jgi:hypothetical protein